MMIPSIPTNFIFTTLKSSIVFIDSGVADYQNLVSGVVPETDIVILESNQDGITQITSVLSQNSYTTVNIVAHGNSGCLYLGNTQLSLDTLNIYQEELKTWFKTISPSSKETDRNLSLYSCNVAAGDAGAEFIERLQLLTQSSIHASSTNVGNSTKGGSWNLDYTKNSHKILKNAHNKIVPFKQNVLETYSGIFAFTDVSITAFDGNGVFDGDNDPGNDKGNTNGIIRTHDTLTLNVAYETDAAGAINPVLTSTLPDGLVWDNLPAWADSGTSTISADKKTITAYLIENITVSEIGTLPLTARALGGQQGTPLNGVTVEINSDANEALTTAPKDFILSSAPNMDIRLLSPTFRGAFINPNDPNDPNDDVDGVVFSYGIGVLGDHPTRTGELYKGASPLEDPFTFKLDLTNVSPGAKIFDWGADLGLSTENALDGITRNYERFTRSTGSNSTAWSQSNKPIGKVNDGGITSWREDRSTPDSGDWTIDGNGTDTGNGWIYDAEVSGAITNGISFPSRYASGVIPASDRWFVSGQVHVWVPLADIQPGNDGILVDDPATVDIDEAEDNGVLTLIPEITDFDPNDPYDPAQSNFGAGTETGQYDVSITKNTDPKKNYHIHDVVAFSLGGPTKYNALAGHPTSGRWVETASVWNAGDGETAVGHQYDFRVSSGKNEGALDLTGIIFGDKFDNTSTKIVPNSYFNTGKNIGKGNQWSRVYVAGGPNSGTFLEYGTDYIIEFGMGGVDADPNGWTDWNSMGDATLADDQSINSYWSEDPTDATLGGTADPNTGVRDSITKWRIKLTGTENNPGRNLQPGETLISLISAETTGLSTIEAGVGEDNEGGHIAANFVAATADFLKDPDTGINNWRTSEYRPTDNRYYSGGSGSHIARGDKLYILDVDTEIEKELADTSSGRVFLAGSTTTFNLDGTLTIPGQPDGVVDAEEVYVTDILPEGLTVVGGSATPAGTTYTSDADGSTQSIQAVEYFNGSNWSSIWAPGANGVRWYFGDVPAQGNGTALPQLSFDVNIPFDATNGENWDNTAVISSDSDSSEEIYRSSEAGFSALQLQKLRAVKSVATPVVPEDTTIAFQVSMGNFTNNDVPWIDLVDILPHDGDLNGADNNLDGDYDDPDDVVNSSINGNYTNIYAADVDPNLTIYVTAEDQATLDSQDGTVDGYADPGKPTDTWYVEEGSGIWQYTLDDVQNGVSGAPLMEDITAIRAASDKTLVDPFLPGNASTNFLLYLTPQDNVGIDLIGSDTSDIYTNKFVARVDPNVIEQKLVSNSVSAEVFAPDKDSDGVPDIDDIDDDNDGIIDTEEGYAESNSSYDFSSITGNGADTQVNTSGQQLAGADVTLTLSQTGNAAINSSSISDDDLTGEHGVHLENSGAGSIDDTAVATFDFSQPVEDFSFTLNQIDAGERVTVNAYIEGNLVTLIPPNLSLYSGSIVDFTGLNTFETDAGDVSPDESRAGSIDISYGTAIDKLEIVYWNSNGGTGGLSFGNFSGTEISTRDTDGDGIPDHCDLDSDNDGISDLFESGFPNPEYDTDNNGSISIAEAETVLGTGNADLDGDGLADIFTPATGTTPANNDPDALPDYLDLDSDGDGIPDTIEARPTANYEANDGDVTNNDIDGDGVIDIFDDNEATGEFGGSFSVPEDTDGDGTYDYLDEDSDDDGKLDSAESGIATPPTYEDPDGSVNAPTNTGEMDNEVLDTSEVAYRELFGTIAGNVSEDIDNDDTGDVDLAGIEITLKDSSGNVIDTKTTDTDGNYLFEDVPAGGFSYTVEETNKEGYGDVSDTDGANDNTIAVSLGYGSQAFSTGNDFVDDELGGITGNVSEDTTGDGTGDTPIPGVTLTLYDAAGTSPILDSVGNPITVVTQTNGDYTFSDVPPGDYTVIQDQPDGYFDVAENEGGDDGDNPLSDNTLNNLISVRVDAGETDSANDFVEGSLSIGATIFKDTNNNGEQDSSEVGISGVTVQLFDGNDNEIPVGPDGILGTSDDASGGIVTDANGNYTFDGLGEGDYQVVIPDSNFASGGALENSPLSSTITNTNDDGTDEDDNGIQTGGTGTEVVSPVINLSVGDEPTGTNEPGQAGNSDDSHDANGDMTVDFGFVPKNFVNGTGASEVIDTTVIDGTTDGNDFINAGPGQDTLTGGDGIDCYHYDITSDGIDVITDFDVDEDKLDFTDIFSNELSSLTIPSNSNPFAEGYVEKIAFGTGVMIQVDTDPSDSGDDPLNKDVVLLRNTSVNDIDATDFIF